MTYEAVLLRETGLPVSGTCDNAVGIEKGAILAQSDPNTVALAAADAAVVAGIAAQEKIASNGQTKVAYYEEGDFRVYASGNIIVGDIVGTASGSGSTNTVYTLSGVANLSGNVVLGTARETCANGETFRMRLNPHSTSQS